MKPLYIEITDAEAARLRAEMQARAERAEAERRQRLMSICESVSAPMRRPSLLDRIAAWVFPAW